MDIRHTPSKEDLQMKDWMEENGIRYFIVLAKADKLSLQQVQKRVVEFRQEIAVSPETPIIAISSENKMGMDEVKRTIQKWVSDTVRVCENSANV